MNARHTFSDVLSHLRELNRRVAHRHFADLSTHFPMAGRHCWYCKETILEELHERVPFCSQECWDEFLRHDIADRVRREAIARGEIDNDELEELTT